MKKRIYLMIEIFRREADARIYFAVKAALKNYSVIIANKSDIWAKRNELKKGIVLFKSLGKTNLKLIRDLKKSGHKIAAWDEEAFVIPKKFNFLVNLRILEENLKLIDYFFTWGKRERNYLKSRFKNHKKLFFDTGNARIDVLKKNNLQLLTEDVNEILNDYGKFTLFLSNFGFYNNSLHDKKKNFLYSLKSNGLVKENTPEYNFFKNEVLYEKNNLKKLPEFIKSFSKNFPNKKLIVKPHPTEKIQAYLDMTKKFKNVIVVTDNKRSNLSWILASEILISVNCTSSVESYFLKKINLNFIQFNDNQHDFYLPKKLSINIYNTKNMIIFLKKFYSNHNFKKKLNAKYLNKVKKNKVLELCFSNYSEKSCSVENMLKIFNKSNFSLQDEDKKNTFWYFGIYFLRRKIREIYLLTKVNVTNKNYSERLKYFRNKMANFNKKIVTEKVEKICHIHKYDKKKIIVKEMYPSMFLIEKID